MDFTYLDAEVVEVKDNHSNGIPGVNNTQGGKLTARPMNLPSATYKTGTVQQASAALMVPPALQGKLSHISKVYGLPFDIGAMSLQLATSENLNTFRNVVDMFSRKSKLLPEILQLVKKLMKADIRLAEYHAGVTKAALKHGEAIDQATADIFTMMSKAAVKADKLEHKVNRRTELRNERQEKWRNFYDDSVISDAMEVVNTEFTTMANNSLQKKDAKLQRINNEASRFKGDIDFDKAANGGSTTTAEKPEQSGGKNGNKKPKK